MIRRMAIEGNGVMKPDQADPRKLDGATAPELPKPPSGPSLWHSEEQGKGRSYSHEDESFGIEYGSGSGPVSVLFQTLKPEFTKQNYGSNTVPTSSSKSCTGRPDEPFGDDVSPSDGQPVVPLGDSVIVAVFGGRQQHIKILFRYLSPMLPDVVDEVHVWDFARNTIDREYLHQASKKSSFRMFVPVSPYIFRPFYSTYANHLCDETILFKFDDDIAFVSNFHHLVSHLRSSLDTYMVFPAIINNDVGEQLMLQSGQSPPLKCPSASKLSGCDVAHGTADKEPCGGSLIFHSGWFTDRQCAEEVHGLFLGGNMSPVNGTRALATWAQPVRVSINLFGMRGRFARSAFTADCMWDDEACLSWMHFHDKFGTSHSSAHFAAVLSSIAVHYAFAPQRELSPELLDRYDALSRIQRLDSE